MGKHTSFIVQLLHNFSDNLTNRLHGLDVIFRPLEILLKIFQREAHYPQNILANCTNESRSTTYSSSDFGSSFRGLAFSKFLALAS